MSDLSEQSGRREAMLKRFAELAMESAEDLLKRQIAAETPEQAAQLASALHKIGRALRQTFLLEDKLERDVKLAARTAQAAADDTRRSERAVREMLLCREVTEMVAEASETVEQAQALCFEVECRAVELLSDYGDSKTNDELLDMIAAEFGFMRGDDEDAEPADDQDAPSAEGGTPGGAPEPPPGAGLVQMPNGGWAPAPDSG